MTPRILELATKAGLYVDFNGKPWPRNMNGEDIEGAYQKFGELLIKECAKVADGGWADPGHQIKQHFGVEE